MTDARRVFAVGCIAASKSNALMSHSAELCTVNLAPTARFRTLRQIRTDGQYIGSGASYPSLRRIPCAPNTLQVAVDKLLAVGGTRYSQ